MCLSGVKTRIGNVLPLYIKTKALLLKSPAKKIPLSFQHIFFRPDYTVGFGISPNPERLAPAPKCSRTITADRELHPALKTYHLFKCQIYIITLGIKSQYCANISIIYCSISISLLYISIYEFTCLHF